MQWFFAEQNERRGPVEAGALLALLEDRSIPGTTLVWRDGLPKWVPFAEIKSEFAGVRADHQAGALAKLTLSAPCIECGQAFPRGELVEINNFHVCAGCKSVFLQKLTQGVPIGGALGLWRRNRDLVVAKNATLPDRCVKCNAAAAQKRLRRQLFWHHQALYLLILFPGLLIYAIVAVIVRHRVTLHVGLCELHRSLRLRNLLIAWLLFLGGIGGIIFACTALSGDLAGIVAGISVIVSLGGAIAGVYSTRIVYARKIDREHAYIGGICPEYLAQLPEWVER